MPVQSTRNKILENTQVTDTVYRMVVETATRPEPGQFYMLKGWGDEGPLLARPISVCDADGRTVTFLYEVRGKGTRLLSKLRAGEQLELTGPVGHGFAIERVRGKVAVVTGGIGFAPMVYVAKSLKDCQVDFFAGFRDASYQLELVRPYVQRVAVATDSGAEGQKGFVTDLFDPADYDFVLTCGPQVMMEKLAKACMASGTTCYVSLERHMACGVGACLGCTCQTTAGAKCVCKDGPVFLAQEVF